MSDWSQHAIWWHAYPLGFVGAEREALPSDAEPKPRLRRFGPWLDYLIELGANGLFLGPVFASETHGYDTVDYFSVDTRLGTVEDLEWLIEACHDKGIRVLLDGVFNHVGRGFEPFQDVLRHGRDSGYAKWFRIDWDADGQDGFGYADFEGHHHLVALNHDEPAVADHVVEVMGRWLSAGVDGWRLDAAYAVPPHFWRDVTDRVRSSHPDAWFVGEVIHGPYEPWLTDARLDSVTQYELWKASWSSLNDSNFYELAWALDRHLELTEHGLPMTFSGNHDVTRLASQLEDERHRTHAAVLLFTLPGVPSVYAGDEQGFTGLKTDTPTGDDAVRPTFPSTPDDLAAFGWPLHRRYQELIAVRRSHAWIASGAVETLELENRQLAYEVISGDDRLIVLLNIADDGIRFDEAAGTGTGAVEVVASNHDLADDPWQVPAHGWTILSTRERETR